MSSWRQGIAGRRVGAVTGRLLASGLLALTTGCADISGSPPTPPSAVVSPAVGLPSPEPLVGPEGTPVPAGFLPTAVSFRSAAGGYLVGTFPCPARRRCPALLRTRDAGLTWRALPIPTTPFRAVRFATQHDGWAFGPQLAATHDGGSTWLPIPPAADVQALEVTSSTVWRLEGGRLLGSPSDRDAWSEETPRGTALAVSHDRVHLVAAGGAVQFGAPDGGWTSTTLPCQGVLAVTLDARAALACSGSDGLQLRTTSQVAAAWSAPRVVPAGGAPAARIAAQANTVYVAAGLRLLVTVDGGLGWTEALAGRVTDIATGGDVTAAVIIGPRLFLSHDAGGSWSILTF